MSTALVRLALSSTKPKKKEAQAIVKMLAERHHESQSDLAMLYAFFMPARSKVVKTDFDWVRQATGNKDPRYYLNYVYVTEQRLIASDGHRLHQCLNKDNLKPGYYLHNGDFYDEPSYAPYPEIDRIIDDLDMYSFNTNQLPGLVTEHNGLVCYALGANQLLIRKDQMDQAINGQSEIQLGLAYNKIKLQYKDRLVVIMALRK